MWDKIVSFETLIFEEIEFKNSSIASFVITFYFYTHCSIFRFEVEKWSIPFLNSIRSKK